MYIYVYIYICIYIYIYICIFIIAKQQYQEHQTRKANLFFIPVASKVGAGSHKPPATIPSGSRAIKNVSKEIRGPCERQGLSLPSFLRPGEVRVFFPTGQLHVAGLRGVVVLCLPDRAHIFYTTPCGGEVLHSCLKMSRTKRPM